MRMTQKFISNIDIKTLLETILIKLTLHNINGEQVALQNKPQQTNLLILIDETTSQEKHFKHFSI